VVTPLLLSFYLSLPPWKPKDSTMEKVQDWMEITLPRTLHWFPFEFFGSPSSSSLKRYSKLCFSRSAYVVQRFEFPLVEQLLRTPRRHTYRSVEFCWTQCENSRFGGRMACTCLTGAPHRSDRLRLQNPNSCFASCPRHISI
jgi:hypothetical protein